MITFYSIFHLIVVAQANAHIDHRQIQTANKWIDENV